MYELKTFEIVGKNHARLDKGSIHFPKDALNFQLNYKVHLESQCSHVEKANANSSNKSGCSLHCKPDLSHDFAFAF